jgi:NlpC/P60 family putative phage cell wall peptidase
MISRNPAALTAVSRAAIVAAARSWIGTPYHHQGAAKHAGADCLGLVRGLYRELYGQEPETPPAYSPDWAEAQNRETLIEAADRHLIACALPDARPGDVLAFRWRRNLPAKHLGVLVATDRMVHATESTAIVEIALTSWWRRRIAAAFSFPAVLD